MPHFCNPKPTHNPSHDACSFDEPDPSGVSTLYTVSVTAKKPNASASRANHNHSMAITKSRQTPRAQTKQQDGHQKLPSSHPHAFEHKLFILFRSAMNTSSTMISIPFPSGLKGNGCSPDVDAFPERVVSVRALLEGSHKNASNAENSVDWSVYKPVYEPMEAKAFTSGMFNKLTNPSQNDKFRVLQHIHNARCEDTNTTRGSPQSMERDPCEELRALDTEIRDGDCVQPPQATNESKNPSHNNSVSFLINLNTYHDDHQRASITDYKDELWYNRSELRCFRRDRDHTMGVLMAVGVKQHNLRHRLSRIWLHACRGSLPNSSVHKMATLMSDPIRNCVGTEKYCHGIREEMQRLKHLLQTAIVNLQTDTNGKLSYDEDSCATLRGWSQYYSREASVFAHVLGLSLELSVSQQDDL